jgi:hypothetical protein
MARCTKPERPVTVSPVAAPQNVRLAIEDAAARTGVDFSYLVATAYRESGFDPEAKAPTSSAAGLFQFIEQTWLGMVKRHGASHGMAAEARQIEQTPGGRFRVADPEARQRILDLRYDPAAASAMAGEYAVESTEALGARLGRAPTSSELYAAHFLGASGAARLIEAAEANPQARADALFPDAARANRAIFRNGREPATVSQVLARLGSAHGEAGGLALRGDRSFAGAGVGADDAPASFIRTYVAAEAARATVGFAPPRSPARVLSPLVIEALAALDTPGAATSGRKGRRA